MAGVDCLQTMTYLAFLILLTVLHAHGTYPSKEEEYLLAGGVGEQKQETWRRRRPEEELVPVPSVVYRSVAQHEPTEPFETCGGCRCCSTSDKSNCVQTRCCYGIKCNLPGKPFGVCAFSPLTCGCGPSNCINTLASSNSSAHLFV